MNKHILVNVNRAIDKLEIALKLGVKNLQVSLQYADDPSEAAAFLEVMRIIEKKIDEYETLIAISTKVSLS